MFSGPNDSTPGKTAGQPAVRVTLSLVYFLAGTWHLLMTVRPLLRAMFGYHAMDRGVVSLQFLKPEHLPVSAGRPHVHGMGNLPGT